MLSNIGFRDFSIVAPAFYEFMVIELKKSWQKAGCGRGEAVNLSSYFVFPIFSPESSGNFKCTHNSKISQACIES